MGHVRAVSSLKSPLLKGVSLKSIGCLNISLSLQEPVISLGPPWLCTWHSVSPSDLFFPSCLVRTCSPWRTWVLYHSHEILSWPHPPSLASSVLTCGSNIEIISLFVPHNWTLHFLFASLFPCLTPNELLLWRKYQFYLVILPDRCRNNY